MGMIREMWDDGEYFLLSGLVLIGLLIATLCAIPIYIHRETTKIERQSIGMTYQQLVERFGAPATRESFDDGTEVVCWKKFHSGSTTYVKTGQVLVPIESGPSVSGWKAVLKRGYVVSMERL